MRKNVFSIIRKNPFSLEMMMLGARNVARSVFVSH